MKKKKMVFNCFILFVVISLTGCTRMRVSPLSTESKPISKEVWEDYYLQPGDNLDIKFFYNPELNENVTIRGDGKISLQLIDEIQAAGLTPAQLDAKLTEKYESQLKQAVISVIVKDFMGQRIYVGGEVNNPKVINLVGRTNALQAIFDAGGLKSSAQLSNVIIVSRDPNNEPIARKVNLRKAFLGRLPEEEYLLKPFDMVYVPKTRLFTAEQFMTSIYNFIPRNIGLGFSYELHSEDKRD